MPNNSRNIDNIDKRLGGLVSNDGRRLYKVLDTIVRYFVKWYNAER